MKWWSDFGLHTLHWIFFIITNLHICLFKTCAAHVLLSQEYVVDKFEEMVVVDSVMADTPAAHADICKVCYPIR